MSQTFIEGSLKHAALTPALHLSIFVGLILLEFNTKNDKFLDIYGKNNLETPIPPKFKSQFTKADILSLKNASTGCSLMTRQMIQLAYFFLILHPLMFVVQFLNLMS